MPRRPTMDTARANFNKLALNDKAMLVINFSHYVHTSYIDVYAVNLYEIDGYLIETWYNKRSKKLEHVEMPRYRDLDVHLKNIYVNFRSLLQ